VSLGYETINPRHPAYPSASVPLQDWPESPKDGRRLKYACCLSGSASFVFLTHGRSVFGGTYHTHLGRVWRRDTRPKRNASDAWRWVYEPGQQPTGLKGTAPSRAKAAAALLAAHQDFKRGVGDLMGRLKENVEAGEEKG
jgi:hypothetical protein